jgi:hypothetical protein
MDNLTQQAISFIEKCPHCIDSIKKVPCDDYEARFKAFLFRNHGIILTNMIDWPQVKQQIEKNNK